MYNSRDHVALELALQNEMKHKWKHQLSKLPEGTLTMCEVGGRPYYRKTAGGSRIYLGGDENEEVQALKKRRFLEQSIKHAEINVSLMENYIENYLSVNAESINSVLPRAYRLDHAEELEDVDFIDGKKWDTQSYDKCSRHKEFLTVMTLKGEFVRSKSEALIANMLYQRGIPYHYEENLMLGDKIIAPDFKIAVRSENRFKYLEHCGMMGSEQYLKGFAWKLREYLANGFIPWRDVFFTFDDTSGGIDTAAIGYMIDSYFI